MNSEEIVKLIAELDHLAQEIVSINSKALWEDDDAEAAAFPELPSHGDDEAD
jgi:hypothetical protein